MGHFLNCVKQHPRPLASLFSKLYLHMYELYVKIAQDRPHECGRSDREVLPALHGECRVRLKVTAYKHGFLRHHDLI